MAVPSPVLQPWPVAAGVSAPLCHFKAPTPGPRKEPYHTDEVSTAILPGQVLFEVFPDHGAQPAAEDDVGAVRLVPLPVRTRALGAGRGLAWSPRPPNVAEKRMLSSH